MKINFKNNFYVNISIIDSTILIFPKHFRLPDTHVIAQHNLKILKLTTHTTISSVCS